MGRLYTPCIVKLVIVAIPRRISQDEQLLCLTRTVIVTKVLSGMHTLDFAFKTQRACHAVVSPRTTRQWTVDNCH